MMKSVFTFLLCSVAWAAHGQAPCNYTLSMFSQLSSSETDSESATLAGDLTSATFNLDFIGTGLSYPSDMMIYIYAPNGNCVVWGGWNINPTGGCTDIGTGAGNSWPGAWDTTVNGNYTYTLPLNVFNLNGSGTWSVTIQNAWTTAATATYDLDITFNGICEGECFDPEACNFVPNAELVNNDLCEYAIDIYPSGLYDCDGNCYFDFDGDGICNSLEVPGCQEPWACNFSAAATDPPLPGFPCTYPDNNNVDCDGNSLLPQFLTQPQDATVSCGNIPDVPDLPTQPAPAAVAYQSLFPESCYDAEEPLLVNFQESTFPGDCPGNYTIVRYWVITDCMGRQNAYEQTITVVDNIVPVVTSGLDTLFLDCNDPVAFLNLQAQDACGGAVTLVEEPDFITLPGSCVGESTQKKISVLSDQCGNVTSVEQVIVVEDNAAPFWLEEPNEVLFTDDIEGDVFGVPVADDLCSAFEVSMATSYAEGACPLSVVLTRTFQAIDECGNTSAVFIQTITEETDLEAELTNVTAATCHGGSDGMAAVEASGGVAPYSIDWGGYNPESLPAGDFTATVNDANQCEVQLPFTISEPAEFLVTLSATIPECNDPLSGSMEASIAGGTGDIDLDWGGFNPNAVSTGTYTVLATDETGCQASASVFVAPADIPDPLELSGDASVAQGDSAAYYYEYTLGSEYAWTHEGATEQQVFSIFAISVQWDSIGFQNICVTETNQDGCVGNPVCLEVFVEDDVWSVNESAARPSLSAFPNPATHQLSIQVPDDLLNANYIVVNGLGAQVDQGRFVGNLHLLNVQALPAGTYLIQSLGASLPFQVRR